MNYAIDEKLAGQGRMVLKRTRALQAVLTVILSVLAAPTLPAGLLLFLAPESDAYSPSFVTGMGLLFLTGAVMVATRIRMPQRLIFDNGQGRLVMEEKVERRIEYAHIPYGDIEGFQVREHVSGRSVSYVVEMIKKDGAFWVLFSTQSRERAERFKERLAAGVFLGAGSAETPAEGTAAPVELVTAPGSATARWKKRVSAGDAFWGFSAVASMTMLIFGAAPYVTSPAAWFFAKAFIVAVIALGIYHVVYSIGKRYSVEITGEEFRYIERGGPIRGRGFTMPIPEIDAIMFNFSVSSPEMVIYVLRREEKEFMQKIKRGAIGTGDILKAMQFMRKVKRIDVGGLSISGKVYLESLLQGIIYERSGRRGL